MRGIASISAVLLMFPVLVLMASCGGRTLPDGAAGEVPASAVTRPGPTSQGAAHATPGSPAAGSTRSRRVLVTLAVPFVPEGDLPTREAVSRQRRSIAEAQDGLLADLEPFGVRLLARFDGPQLALLVDDDAAAYLRSSPRVAGVQDDVPKPPDG